MAYLTSVRQSHNSCQFKKLHHHCKLYAVKYIVGYGSFLALQYAIP